MLAPTSRELLLDPQGRPYFLWDLDIDLAAFERLLRHPDPEVRAYFVGKLMRQAKPDDVFQFVTRATIRELWPRVQRYLGRSREFWTWLLEAWDSQERDGR